MYKGAVIAVRMILHTAREGSKGGGIRRHPGVPSIEQIRCLRVRLGGEDQAANTACLPYKEANSRASQLRRLIREGRLLETGGSRASSREENACEGVV